MSLDHNRMARGHNKKIKKYNRKPFLWERFLFVTGG